MKRIPRWAVWSGLTLAVWLLWGLLLHGSLSQGLDSLRAERDASAKKLGAMQARIAEVPALVAHLDSTVNILKADFARYHTLETLNDLMTDLESEARRVGVPNASAGPDLKSVLDLEATPPVITENRFHCDTLLVELGATNDYRRIGHWLDAIEHRSDFQHWVECRWTAEGDDGFVHVDAMVALLVTDDDTPSTTHAEATNGR